MIPFARAKPEVSPLMFVRGMYPRPDPNPPQPWPSSVNPASLCAGHFSLPPVADGMEVHALRTTSQNLTRSVFVHSSHLHQFRVNGADQRLHRGARKSFMFRVASPYCCLTLRPSMTRSPGAVFLDLVQLLPVHSLSTSSASTLRAVNGFFPRRCRIHSAALSIPYRRGTE